MKWFRSNIRRAARLALFGLVVQFALTFGHSHGLAQASTPSTMAAQGTGQRASAAAHPAVRQQLPADQDRDHPADENCAICAVMAMAGQILLATPPQLELPNAIEMIELAAAAHPVDLTPVGSAFQARAPPVS